MRFGAWRFFFPTPARRKNRGGRTTVDVFAQTFSKSSLADIASACYKAIRICKRMGITSENSPTLTTCYDRHKSSPSRLLIGSLNLVFQIVFIAVSPPYYLASSCLRLCTRETSCPRILSPSRAYPLGEFSFVKGSTVELLEGRSFFFLSSAPKNGNAAYFSSRYLARRIIVTFILNYLSFFVPTTVPSVLRIIFDVGSVTREE